jgi:hypothetical protein
MTTLLNLRRSGRLIADINDIINDKYLTFIRYIIRDIINDNIPDKPRKMCCGFY